MDKIPSIVAKLRKEKGWSQTDLANQSEVSREMIGKYERGKAIPSVDAAKKIADAFGVSLDFLVGEGLNSSFDKKTVQRLQDIQDLDDGTRHILFDVIDTFLRDAKTRKAYAS